jgi:hypothetical protein
MIAMRFTIELTSALGTDSRSPTAMSFAVVSSLYPHPSTALEETS